MRDLEIWRRLHAGTASVDDIRELGEQNHSRLGAFIGRVLPLAAEDDPRMRIAALGVLAGSRGVAGVRVIVARLDDDDADVRAAAVAALHATAQHAPVRFVHALFHERDDVRRAALGCELSTQVAELAIYLRSDPATADLATKARWPDGSLGLALDMYRGGRVAAAEVVEMFTHESATAIATLLAGAHRRAPEAVDDYLERAGRETSVGLPSGRDVLDTLVHALAAAGAPWRALDHLVEAMNPRKQRALARRALVSLLAHLQSARNDALWSLCIALDPRVIAYPLFDASLVPAAIGGLFRFHWPVKPGVAHTERLLELPIVKHDLALAAAIVGLLPAKRLATLVRVLGEADILARLRASDHGWDALCQLPPESPPFELVWLARIAIGEYPRYVALAGRAIGVFSGKRLETFVDQLPRRHRPAIFSAALAAVVNASGERIEHVCRAIAPRVDRATLIEILKALVPTDERGDAVLGLLRAAEPKLLVSALTELDMAAALRVVALVDADPLPRDRELAVMRAFEGRAHPVIADWRARCEAFGERAAPVVVAPRVRRELTPAERRKIETCSHRDLGDALKPAFDGLVSGLCSALAGRGAAAPSLAACNALLGCSDPLPDVARQLDRFVAATEKFDADLDNEAVTWVRTRELPPLAHARLWRWDAHSFALADWIEQTGGVLPTLQYVDKLPGTAARKTLWKGISEAVMLLRFRKLDRMRALAADAALYCASRIDGDVGHHAARIVTALVESRVVAVSVVRDTLLDRVTDAKSAAREYVGRILRLEGLPEPPPVASGAEVPLADEIRACTDLDALVAWCRDPRPAIVEEAALALCALGEPGQLRLAELLVLRDRLPTPIPILQTIALWDHAPAVEAIRALVREPDLPPVWQFHVALALLARGEKDALERALAAARAPGGGWYFRREDWDALVKLADVVQCALALVDSPHHHAYQRSLGVLLSLTQPSADVRAALTRFLEVGSDRPLHLRVAVARNLAAAWADPIGLPILAEYIADERADDWIYTLELVPSAAKADIAKLLVSAALMGGQDMCSEKRMWLVVQRLRRDLDRETCMDLDVRIFEEAGTGEARRAASQYAMSEGLAHERLERVAEVFAWGVKRGVELTGGLYRIHMTSKERDFGHTRLDGNRIFVSPLPMLRAETHGQDVVEGLILHELGHHVYHRGDEALKLWKQAHAEGIGHFLNLIADEHLERNLRGLDATYGDRLKRLGAYAFQHAPQEIKVSELCAALGAATAHALIHADLDVAYAEDSVRLRRGAILAELDRSGHVVARFARALRMGLGNRAGDPLIAQALAMCGKELRTLDMRGLYDLTKRLVHLFGGEIEIARVFGGPEGLVFGEREQDVFGAGIDDDVLQREVERILDPRQSNKTGRNTGPIDRLQINVNPDTQFNRITHIERVRGDAELHRKLATDVQRHSTRLRAYLDDLGLRWLPMRARTQGRALDRTRLRALVTRNDPRILIARTPTRKTDLFLGTIVDCSSSMTAGQNIERAKRFAVLVAEAVRPLPGVEARFFGFTDSVIYDAGTARDCNVVALRASGGNNDAAALYNAANIAVASPQRAKVLVMISDGLPTECSVAALRSLVTQLTRRRGIVCAQVAVRKLEEVAFPNYVVLDDREPDVAVARFGRMIGELARRSLSA